MSAPNLYYVDPNAGSDAGGVTGAIGNPWKSVQHALNTITRDATNGDQINLKAGTSDILAAVLSLATYGSPAAPLVFRGYTSAAGDGGVGVLDGNNLNNSIFSGAQTYINFIDMRCTNTGSATVLNLSGGYCQIVRCEVDTSTGSGIISSGTAGHVIGNYVHDIGGNAGINAGGEVAFNRFVCGSKNPTIGITSGGIVAFNIVKVASASHGIDLDYGAIAHNNSVWSNGGTGTGISDAGSSRYANRIFNNIIEGFSGSGGKGVRGNAGAGAADMLMLGYNSFYNNATNVSNNEPVLFDLTASDQTLSGSPFTNASGGDFSLNNTASAGASCRGSAYPGVYPVGASYTSCQDRGAIQHADPAAAASPLSLILQPTGTY